MAHWFHRNPIKASAPLSFESLRDAASSAAASQILQLLRQSRAHLLDVLTNPSNEISTIEQASITYLSLLQGLVYDIKEPNKDSIFRKSLKFKWTNSICGNTPTVAADTMFEMVSMIMELAMWYSKHAAKLASNPNITMEEAKEVHKSLRTAAGMFQYVKENLMPKLGDIEAEKGVDTDPRIIEAYRAQCIAEAQEVTVARAIELKHNASLISAIAYETSKLFMSAAASLNSVDPTKAEKWKKYLDLKSALYQAYAHCFHGEALLDKEECGNSIRALQESETMYKKTQDLCKEYAIARGPGTNARPGDHPFFKKLAPLIKLRLDKSTRENGFIYYHKVPEEVPDLELKATYGLASPQEFASPLLHPSWTPQVYESFDMSKALPAQVSSNEEVKQVKEPEISGPSDAQPKNESGCTVS